MDLTSINSLSGGKTSSYMAANYAADVDIFSLVRINGAKVKDAKLRQMVEDKIQAPFIGTAEQDTILNTMFDLEQFIGREITWVTGPSFDDVIDQKGGYLPNRISRYCTTELKTVPILKWILHNVDGIPSMRFGYRANESRRANKMMEKTLNGVTYVKATFEKRPDGRNKWEMFPYCRPEFPLLSDGIYKDEVEIFWDQEPGVRFAYMNNCVGCFWRSPLLLKKMYDKEPTTMEWFTRQEADNAHWRSDVSYREIARWKTQMEMFDDDFNECDSGNCGL